MKTLFLFLLILVSVKDTGSSNAQLTNSQEDLRKYPTIEQKVQLKENELKRVNSRIDYKISLIEQGNTTN